MNSHKISVLVLKGGWSSERNISLLSGRVVEDGLKKAGFRVSSLDIKKRSFLRELLKRKFNVAFITLHGRFGEDGGIQAVLDGMGVPYTGSGVLASALAMNKLFAKKIFRSSGIPTPEWQEISKYELPQVRIPFPVVVKPSAEGSAIGVSIVERKEELIPAFRRAFKYNDKIIVEKYIEGIELSVGILGEKALGVIELRPKRKFYDYKAKYVTGMCEHIVPAPLPQRDYKRVQEIALDAHRALGCSGYSRVDLRMDNKKRIYVLEVNTIPGMLRLSLFPESARAEGIDFVELLKRMVMLAMRS